MGNVQSTYQIVGRFTGVQQIVSGFGQVLNASERTSRQIVKNSEAAHKSYSKMSGTFNAIARGSQAIIMSGREVGYIWHHQAASIDKYTEAAKRLAAVQQRLYTLNLSPEDNQKALKGIEDVVTNLRGMRIDEVTDTFLDLHAALGSVEHGLEFLGTASKYRFNMQALFGEKFSKEQIERQVLDAFRFMEQIGVMRATGAVGPGGKRAFTEQDKKRAEEYFDTISKLTAGTRGMITGSTLQPLAGRGGVSMMGMSSSGLLNLGFLLNEMGGPTTGTALMSLWSKMVGGQMTQSALENLVKIVGKENVDFTKIQFNQKHPGIPSKAMPGWFKQAHLLQENPAAFADFMADALKKNAGIDASKMEPKEFNQKATEVIFGITKQRTAANMLAKLIIMRDQIRKDFDIFSQAKGVDAQYDQALQSIAGRIEELKAARENFHALLGQSLINIEGSALKEITPLLKSLDDFLLHHPDAAKMAGYLLLTGKALSGIGQTLMVLRLSGLIGQITATGEEAAAAAPKVAAYKRSLGGIPRLVGTTIVLMLATEVIATILKYKAEAEEAWAQAKGVAKEGADVNQRLYAAGDAESIKKLTRGGMPAAIANLIKADANQPLDSPGLVGRDFWEKTVLGHRGSTEKLASRFKEFMPELAQPSQYAMFREALKSNKSLTDEQKNQMVQASITAFPKAYEAYDAAMKKAAGDQYAAIDALVKADQEAARQMRLAAEAAAGFADKVNNLKLAPAGAEQGGEGQGDGQPVKLPGHAKGGYFRRRMPIIIGEGPHPEFALPEPKLRGMLSAARGAGGDVKTAQFTYAPNISFPASASPETVRTFQAMLDEHTAEMRRMHEDYLKDRDLSH